MELLKQVFDKIGGNGPIILMFSNIFLMYEKTHFQFYYVLFYFINIILNTILKQLFRQPRPSIDEKTFLAVLKKNERFVRRDGHPYDIFGMPSGHTQSVIYSTLFNYSVFQNVKILFLFLIISLITMIQRVVYNHHTVLQILIGGCFCVVVTYIAIYFAKMNIAGNFTMKKDDNYIY
jgi:membrane-associated phospholipid phosphatase